MNDYKKVILELKNTLQKKGISEKVICQKLGIYPSNLKRALSGNHSMGIKMMCQIAEIAGIDVVLKNKLE